MTQIKGNLSANFIGRFYNAALSLALVPVYIKFIGIEGYGLVGFYATLQAMFNLLDIGFSNTLKRELAGAAESQQGRNSAGDFLKTLQGFYLGIAALACVLTLLLSPILARHWLSSEFLSVDVLTQVLLLFGFIVANRMVYGFYSGGLLGLQKQVLYNVQDGLFVTLRSVGAVLILWLVSPTVVAFFAWQAISGFAWSFVCAALLWKNLPVRNRRASFRFSLLKDVWRYAAGLSLNSVLGILLNQVDKIVLSTMLPLEMFGYYTLAGSVAASLQYFGTPVYTVFFPVFVQKISRGLIPELSTEYHKATQIMAVAIFPVAGVFIFFSKPLLLAWTQDAGIADQAGLLVVLLSLSTALNQIAALPHNLQLAWKYTRISVIANLVAVVLLAPALYFGIRFFGGIGAAAVSVLLNLGYVLIIAQVVHRKFLVGEFLRWILGDVALVAAVVALVGGVSAAILPPFESRLLTIGALCLVGLLMSAAAIMAAGLVRKPTVAAIRAGLRLR